MAKSSTVRFIAVALNENRFYAFQMRSFLGIPAKAVNEVWKHFRCLSVLAKLNENGLVESSIPVIGPANYMYPQKLTHWRIHNSDCSEKITALQTRLSSCNANEIVLFESGIRDNN